LVGLTLYLVDADDSLTAVVIGALVFGSLVPYIRAKAESMQISCSGGIAERTERLIISLTAIGLEGLGVPFALAIGIWLLLILAVVTVIQRILIVKAAL
jgi:CDP-diacylglycerol--glycerol-3-phosphate 3-phosphatidyltransferase